MTIGERIKQARNAKGLTQKQLGAISGTSEITIRQYELGKRQPRLEQFQRIATALGVDVNWLMNGRTLEERDQEWNAKAARQFEEALIQEAKEDEAFLNTIQPYLAPLEPLTDEESALKTLLNSMGYDIIRIKENYFFTYKSGSSEISKDDLCELLNCAQNGLKIAAKTLELKLRQRAFDPRYRAETAPQSPQVPQEGTDTTPPPETPETPENGG